MLCFSSKLTDYELCIASNLVDPLTLVVDWEDIGGLEATIREIRDSVIIPFKHRERFTKSGLIQPPKGAYTYKHTYIYIHRHLLFHISYFSNMLVLARRFKSQQEIVLWVIS